MIEFRRNMEVLSQIDRGGIGHKLPRKEIPWMLGLFVQSHRLMPCQISNLQSRNLKTMHFENWSACCRHANLATRPQPGGMPPCVHHTSAKNTPNTCTQIVMSQAAVSCSETPRDKDSLTGCRFTRATSSTATITQANDIMVMPTTNK